MSTSTKDASSKEAAKTEAPWSRISGSEKRTECAEDEEATPSADARNGL